MSSEESNERVANLDYLLGAGMVLPAIPLFYLWARYGTLDYSTPYHIRNWILGLVMLMGICSFWFELRFDSWDWLKFVLLYGFFLFGEFLSRDHGTSGETILGGIGLVDNALNVLLAIVILYATWQAANIVGMIGEIITYPLKAGTKSAWKSGSYFKVAFLGIVFLAISLVFLFFEFIG